MNGVQFFYHNAAFAAKQPAAAADYCFKSRNRVGLCEVLRRAPGMRGATPSSPSKDAPMRRYLQGTLDFACGIYAVINALSLTHSLDLAGARAIFRETHLDITAHPDLWADYTGNNTDHYWLVRHMLGRWCSAPPHRLRVTRPFGEEWSGAPSLASAKRYLPENHPPSGPLNRAEAAREAEQTWRAAHDWLTPAGTPPRALLMRFHRFVPGMQAPIVSHWTTGKCFEGAVLHLHDASSEPRALLSLPRNILVTDGGERAPVRIVPESLFLLEKA